MQRVLRNRVTPSYILAWVMFRPNYSARHLLTQHVVREYARQFSLKVFVETGTYLGEMVFAVRNQFEHIISVELDKMLYLLAVLRFAGWRHIRILQGDSARLLPVILQSVREPSLFWLDAHHSGGITARGKKETPIQEELAAILAHVIKDHVILIDDAIRFDGTRDYPTLDALRNFVATIRPTSVFEVRDDIIRIHPEWPRRSQH